MMNLFLFTKGEGTLTLDEQLVEVKTGDVVFVPRDTWHGLDNTGNENLLMVFQYSPAGFEEYFIENGTPAGMPAKERTRRRICCDRKNMEWFIKTSCKDWPPDMSLLNNRHEGVWKSMATSLKPFLMMTSSLRCFFLSLYYFYNLVFSVKKNSISAPPMRRNYS